VYVIYGHDNNVILLYERNAIFRVPISRRHGSDRTLVKYNVYRKRFWRGTIVIDSRCCETVLLFSEKTLSYIFQYCSHTRGRIDITALGALLLFVNSKSLSYLHQNNIIIGVFGVAYFFLTPSNSAQRNVSAY